jgi:hypothetical protein
LSSCPRVLHNWHEFDGIDAELGEVVDARRQAARHLESALRETKIGTPSFGSETGNPRRVVLNVQFVRNEENVAMQRGWITARSLGSRTWLQASGTRAGRPQQGVPAEAPNHGQGLSKGLPHDWQEQRRFLGFSA